MTTTEQPSEDIVRKIQKMLSLANAGGTPDEAATAMAMAQKMLARYNLDYHTVSKGAGVLEEKREKNQMEYGAMYQWQRDLWECIAKVNFCWHWITTVYGPSRHAPKIMVRSKKHMVLGRQSNVISVKLMGEYLCDTLERILPYPNTERLSRSALSWRAGAAESLISRLKIQYLESQEVKKTVDGPSTALTMFDVATREEKANYDTRYGAGAWDRKVKRDAEWEAGQAERDKVRVEQRAQEEKEWLEYLQKESPEQKKQREKLEEKEMLKRARRHERDNERWYRADRAESRKTDWSAREAGSSAGRQISLSRQVESGVVKGRLK